METLTNNDRTLSPVIDALHGAYNDLCAHVKETTGKDMPSAIIVVKRDARAWGHITVSGNAWKTETQELDSDYAYAPIAISMGLGLKTVEKGFHEIMVSGENLGRGAVAVFGTLAHETAHAYNIVSGIRDVDSNGRHNKKFKSTAESLFGLEITKVSESIGWSHTEVPDACAKQWRKSIKEIEKAIATVAQHSPTSFGGSFGGGGFFGGGASPTGRNKNLLKATCGCGSTLRASAKVLKECEPTCKKCGEAFIA